MLRNIICVGSLALLCGTAFADDVTITREKEAPGAVIERRATDVDKPVARDKDDCSSKTVTKTDGEGDSVSRTRTKC
jgi:hypothetical protein